MPCRSFEQAVGWRASYGTSLFLPQSTQQTHAQLKQAHALTPTLTSAANPSMFPFLTLLVSGGHTLLVLASLVWPQIFLHRVAFAMISLVPFIYCLIWANGFVSRVCHDFAVPFLVYANGFASHVRHIFNVLFLICAKGFVGHVHHNFAVPLSHLCKCLCELHSPRFHLSPSLICANSSVSRVHHNFTCPPLSSVQIPL